MIKPPVGAEVSMIQPSMSEEEEEEEEGSSWSGVQLASSSDPIRVFVLDQVEASPSMVPEEPPSSPVLQNHDDDEEEEEDVITVGSMSGQSSRSGGGKVPLLLKSEDLSPVVAGYVDSVREMVSGEGKETRWRTQLVELSPNMEEDFSLDLLEGETIADLY